jgi:DNA-binding transcriptional LysR family regulator
MPIGPDKLARIDLNLLVALAILLEELNVTRAAERLFITQPAMSRTLSRLRELLDDPLFTRSSHGLIATPRAEQIAQSLPALLDEVSVLVAKEEFDPASHDYCFRVSLPEQLGHILFSELLAKLTELAPAIQIEADGSIENLDTRLANGSLDFAMDIERPVPADIESTPILSAVPVLIARHDHPLANKQQLQWQEIIAFPFIHCLPLDELHDAVLLDQLLDKLGIQCVVNFRTTQLLSAIQALQKTDGLMFGPGLLVNSSLLANKLTVLDAPAELCAFNTTGVLYQHARTSNSPAHQWFKKLLIETAQLCLAE